MNRSPVARSKLKRHGLRRPHRETCGAGDAALTSKRGSLPSRLDGFCALLFGSPRAAAVAGSGIQEAVGPNASCPPLWLSNGVRDGRQHLLGGRIGDVGSAEARKDEMRMAPSSTRV
jgi:hypothetical protein